MDLGAVSKFITQLKSQKIIWQKYTIKANHWIITTGCEILEYNKIGPPVEDCRVGGEGQGQISPIA